MNEIERKFISPGSDTHEKLLTRVRAQISESYSKMSQFYGRWNQRELEYQAYVPIQEWDSIYKKSCQDKSLAGVKKQDANIIVPYSFSSIRTIVTYLATVFLGRKPIFTVGTYNADFVENARNMEKLLQYNAEHCRLVKEFTQWLYNGEIYGLGILKTSFVTETQPRTTIVKDPLTGNPIKTRTARTVYQGNKVENIDPFMFFPDPRVPMLDVAQKGEFVYWRSFVGKFTLQRAGETYAWLDHIKGMSTPRSGNPSLRNLAANGNDLNLQYDFSTIDQGSPWVQIDEGTVELIPEEIGLELPGVDPKKPYKFLVTLANESQFIRFELFSPDHQQHPVVVNEPYALGNGFGNCGISDYLAPFQNSISWFLNSHIFNVKGVVNNSFIYDPSMVEEKDLKSDKPGKLIRMKPRAFGVDLNTYFKQIVVSDVTSGHVGDMQNLMRIANDISAITDNMRGQQDSGGRKTATEIRATIEAASSRLASHAQFISGASVSQLGKQMSLNLQQFLSEDFCIQVVGDDGSSFPVSINPESVVGDFYFPVHDGSLPLDKVALFDIWQQALTFVAGNQALAQQYDVGRIFEFVARLGGAENIDQFRLNHMPNDQVLAQVQAGNLVPVGDIANATQAF